MAINSKINAHKIWNYLALKYHKTNSNGMLYEYEY